MSIKRLFLNTTLVLVALCFINFVAYIKPWKAFPLILPFGWNTQSGKLTAGSYNSFESFTTTKTRGMFFASSAQIKVYDDTLRSTGQDNAGNSLGLVLDILLASILGGLIIVFVYTKLSKPSARNNK